MSNETLYLLLALPVVVAAVIAVLALRSRRRGEREAETARIAAEARAASAPVALDRSAAPAAADPQWAPPAYAASTQTMDGPSLRVGIGIMRVKDGNLLVSWNALNDGSVPVDVQWGAPEVQLAGGDVLMLRYTANVAGEGPFQPPETRLFQPGEIVSRSANVPVATLGRELAGLRVTVAVGYGPADALAALKPDAAAYADWQKTAVSAPRSAPRA